MKQADFLFGRCNSSYSDFHPKRVILIGAGAIKDSWKPLENVFLNANNISDINRLVYTSDDKNNQMACYLSQMVFKYNSICLGKEKLRNDYKRNNITKTEKSKLENQFSSFLYELSLFTNAISSSFNNTTLLPKEEIEFIRECTTNDTGLIVLNWDETLWGMDHVFPNVLQIHGRASIPGSIIYPMEVCLEKIHFNKLLKQQGNDLTYQSLETVHRLAYEWFYSAEEVISWGVAYNVYESELNSILETAFYDLNKPSQLRKVININVDQKTDYSISRLMNIPLNNIENYFK